MLILGFGFRIACLLLFLTMMVAAYKHLSLPPEAVKSGWKGASHALEFLTIYLALFLTGPGKFALNQKIKFGKKR
jgi:putative oxidoreductase